MNNLSSFLQTLRQKINKGELQRKKIAETISKYTGVEIQVSSITVRGGVAHTRLSGAFKQELLQKKTLILESLNKEGILLEDIL